MTEALKDYLVVLAVYLVVTTYCAAFVATAVGAGLGIWANVRWVVGRVS